MAQYDLYRPSAPGAWGGPFDQLQREVDALFHRFAGRPAGSAAWRGVYPPVNLYETPEAYMVTAELPGVATEDIHVSIEGSTLTLRGERKIDYTSQKDASLHRRERPAGSFQRAFELPATIESEKVEAVHRNGVLMLRLPKTPQHQPRQIAVQAS